MYWKGTLFLRLLSFPPLFLSGLFLFLFPSLLNMAVLNISLMTVLYPSFFQNMRILLLNTLQIAIQNVQNVIYLPFDNLLIAFPHFIFF